MKPLKLIETEPGEYSLLLEAGDTEVDELVQDLGHEPGGYFWEGVAQFLVRNEAPALEGRFSYDPEGSMFCAFGQDRDALEKLGALMRAVATDAERMRGLIASALASGFQFGDDPSTGLEPVGGGAATTEMDARETPQVVTQLYDRLPLPSDLEAKTIDFPWKGPQAHLAAEDPTSLKRALTAKTYSGLAFLVAASLVWSARRLRLLTDVSPCLWMAEALLCWQSDPRYFDGYCGSSPGFHHRVAAVRAPAAGAAVAALCTEAFVFNGNIGSGWYVAGPAQSAENVIALTRHVLGPHFEAPLDRWLKATIRRLDALAPYPDSGRASHFDTYEEFLEHEKRAIGRPLPIEVADMTREIGSDDLAPLYADFIASVDWAANPYLRSPEEMRQCRFTGEPYRHG